MSQLFSNQDKSLRSKQLFLKENRYLVNEFLALIELKKTDSFTECIRKLLEVLELPSSSRDLDLLTESYARRIFWVNKFGSYNSDGLYMLLYSCIMLIQSNGTMKLRDFLQSNSKINEGEDFPRDFMVEVYNSVLSLVL